ncbi:MAG TPA: putative DNA binding domain-containing protein [Methanothrix sp.]|nr:putative DNA binding domain-containing protein [Methanothrix sp.]
MTQEDLQSKLASMMAHPAETEWIEFKEARNDYHFDELGQYFSALSNEANLMGQPAGWLIFGVTNRPPRQICGTKYRSSKQGLEKLKVQISQHTNHQITFIDIHELKESEGRVLLFQIPPAPRGIPTTWNGVAYGRISERNSPLSLHEIELIRRQIALQDWSAQICEGAAISDLDPQAIKFARQQYREKNKSNPHLASEADQWDDLTFLNKARICINGKVTRSAIILLGRSEAENFIYPAIARITWILKDANNVEKDYQHFGPPLILAVDQVFSRIRNLTYRYMAENRLFPIETTQYDRWVIRETLHNAIAHQDYTQGGRINVVEEAESLLITNVGEFLPGSVEEAIRRDAPPEIYQNRFLAEAMVSLNMIDTIGSGIKRMFLKQRERSFPMPDYDLSEPKRVKVRIIGKILDERYTRMLMTRTDLDLMAVIALDKIQKGKRITDEEFKALKKKKLIEGRRSNLFVSAKIAVATDTKVDYIKRRGIDKEYSKKLIMDYLAKFGEATREEISQLLIDKLSDSLSEDQKESHIKNILQEMRKEGSIKAQRMGRRSIWFSSKS